LCDVSESGHKDDAFWSQALLEGFVGADRIPHVSAIDRALFGYFGMNLVAEPVVEQSGIGWTTLRATQFHDLILMVGGRPASRRRGLRPGKSREWPGSLALAADIAEGRAVPNGIREPRIQARMATGWCYAAGPGASPVMYARSLRA
jgi:uncharacterized protein YbjT (DUF2867 family)